MRISSSHARRARAAIRCGHTRAGSGSITNLGKGSQARRMQRKEEEIEDGFVHMKPSQDGRATGSPGSTSDREDSRRRGRVLVGIFWESQPSPPILHAAFGTKCYLQESGSWIWDAVSTHPQPSDPSGTLPNPAPALTQCSRYCSPGNVSTAHTFSTTCKALPFASCVTASRGAIFKYL